MAEKNSGGTTTADKAFVISRTFAAPRDLVWKAYTEADRLTEWWGPKGFTMLRCEIDLRPGGVFHYGMRAPDGSVMGQMDLPRDRRAGTAGRHRRLFG